MKRLMRLWFLPLLSASLAMAQTPTCNTSTHTDSNSNICTTFTTKGGAAFANNGAFTQYVTYSVDTQDGLALTGNQVGALALDGFYGEGTPDFELPTDPLKTGGLVPGYGSNTLLLEGGTLTSFTTTAKSGPPYLSFTDTYTVDAGTEQTQVCTNGQCLYYKWQVKLTVPFTYIRTVLCGGRAAHPCPVYQTGEGTGVATATPFFH
jgi:hypothetical protein